MSNETNLTTFISQLEDLKRNNDYLTIGQNLDSRFDSSLKEILEKWTSKIVLDPNEEKFLDLYSFLQLEFVQRQFLLFNPTNNDENSIQQILRQCLFRKKSIDVLRDAVATIRDEHENNNDDRILPFFMRLIDARTVAYRLCFKDLHPSPNELNEEFIDCLKHSETKEFLHQVKNLEDRPNDSSWSKILNNRHRFFIGCSTFAVALFEKNTQVLKGDENKKLIFLLTKYVRVTLNRNDFVKDETNLYCLRGILALLTNCVPTDDWMEIINRAFVSNHGDEIRRENPFNEKLFSLIVSRLLNSTILQKQAIQSESCTITSLIDIALIFLNKWSDDPSNLALDENDDASLKTMETNQVLLYLRSDDENETKPQTSQIIMPYVDAKYDRLRLMSLATLSNIMSYNDFQQFQQNRPELAQDMVKIIFDFIKRASTHPTHRFKGIHCDRLLCYLLRFLVQDVIKHQTIDYVDILLNFARDRNIFALKILRRLSSSPKLKENLLNNKKFQDFLNDEAKVLFDCDQIRKKIVEETCQHFVPARDRSARPSTSDGGQQAFISYSHADKDACLLLEKRLEESNVFTKIWIDRNFIRGNITDSITNAMNKCQVVFTLLSDSYCASDTCRREWNYATIKNIKIYPIHVRKEFKRTNYDWILFDLLNALYYRLFEPDGLDKLIRDLRRSQEIRPATAQNVASIATESTSSSIKSESCSTTTTMTNQSRKNSNANSSPISHWTSNDIQRWCLEKKLDKWIEPLANYHGAALIELQKVLSVESHFPYFLNINGLNGFDLALFRCELNLLISEPKTRYISPRKQSSRRNSQKKHP